MKTADPSKSKTEAGTVLEQFYGSQRKVVESKTRFVNSTVVFLGDSDGRSFGDSGRFIPAYKPSNTCLKRKDKIYNFRNLK